MDKKLSEELKKISQLELKEGIDLSRYSTMKLYAVGDLLIVKEIEALIKALNLLKTHKKDYRLIGWGANTIVNNDSPFVWVKLDLAWDTNQLNSPQTEYLFSASTPLNILTSHAMKFGLSGWEVFTGIPASLGGAVYMNAGTNLGEIGPLIKKVTVLNNNGEIEDREIAETSFSYRKNHFIKDGEVILYITMIHKGLSSLISQKIKDYLSMRQTTQPLNEKTCGCVFKNALNVRAGQAIDTIGLKGLTLNSLKVSHKHANFMENHENAKASDFFCLAKLVQDELKLNLGIEFELEVKID